MTITEKIDAITGIPPEYKFAKIPAPRSCKIELTARCNFQCSFCARSMNLREFGDLDRKFYNRVIREMKEAGVDELGLFYLGESFMCSWLPDAIREAKLVGYPYVFLTTNGSLSNESKVEACMLAGLNSLKFSFNYADADQLVEIARVKRKYFNTIIKNIKDAYEVRERGGYNCGLYASYIAYDGEQGERMKEAVEEVRPYLDEVYALPLYNQAGFVTAREREMGLTPTVGNRGRLDNLREGIPCWALFTEAHISWDGKLTGCCFSHTADFDFGDLNEVHFMDAWNSERAQWFRNSHLGGDVSDTPCANCFMV